MTTGTPSSRAIASASSGVVATLPGCTGIPYRRRMSLAWYSWIFTFTTPGTQRLAAVFGGGGLGGVSGVTAPTSGTFSLRFVTPLETEGPSATCCHDSPPARPPTYSTLIQRAGDTLG